MPGCRCSRHQTSMVSAFNTTGANTLRYWQNFVHFRVTASCSWPLELDAGPGISDFAATTQGRGARAGKIGAENRFGGSPNRSQRRPRIPVKDGVRPAVIRFSQRPDRASHCLSFKLSNSPCAPLSHVRAGGRLEDVIFSISTWANLRSLQKMKQNLCHGPFHHSCGASSLRPRLERA